MKNLSMGMKMFLGAAVVILLLVVAQMAFGQSFDDSDEGRGGTDNSYYDSDEEAARNGRGDLVETPPEPAPEVLNNGRDG